MVASLLIALALVGAAPVAAQDMLVIYKCPEVATCSAEGRCRQGSARVSLGVIEGHPVTAPGEKRFFLAYLSTPQAGAGTFLETEVSASDDTDPARLIAAAGDASFRWFRSDGMQAPLHLHYVHPKSGLLRNKDTRVVSEFACRQELF